MSANDSQQEFSDLTWFHASAITLVTGMPVTVRGAGKFSVRVTNPDLLEQSIANPDEIERVRFVWTDSFGEVIANLTVSNKNAILGMKGQLEMELRQKAEPKFNELGLQLTNAINCERSQTYGFTQCWLLPEPIGFFVDARTNISDVCPNDCVWSHCLFVIVTVAAQRLAVQSRCGAQRSGRGSSRLERDVGRRCWTK